MRPLDVLFTGVLVMAGLPHTAHGQFDQIPIPEELAALDFMIGEWEVDGAFRTPDHVGSDRTLWYLTEGGIIRFDGRAWIAYQRGQDRTADSILRQTGGRAEPYAFSNGRHVSRIQDGFALLIDDGRTSGTTLVYFDVAARAYVATALHAPTGGITTSRAAAGVVLPVFEGAATDRRGPRVFRQRFAIQGPDSYAVHTDVSFDEGTTWIRDQIVQHVRRR